MDVHLRRKSTGPARTTTLWRIFPKFTASSACFIATVFVIFAQTALAKTFYVSTSGKDSNAGTISKPWRTIRHAANAVAAGDTVYVRAGVYNELVSIPKSGSASGGTITFSSYTGELAVIDGTGLPIPEGQWGLVTIENRSYIIIRGFEIRNYKTKSAQVPIGLYIFGAGTNISVLNNHIHNIETEGATCSGANALGLAAYGTSAPASINNLTISGNQIDHTSTGCSETLTVDGNVENFRITDNIIHDTDNIGIDAAGYYGVAPAGSKCGTQLCDRARYGQIRGNTIYNITSNHNPAYGPGIDNHSYGADGIYVDGGTQIVIERNLVHNTDIGIELASENPGNEAPGREKTDFVVVRNNVIHHSNAPGITIGGYADSGPGGGGTDRCSILNNTLFANNTANTGAGEFQIQYHATGNIFENNIIYAGAQGLFINDFTASEPNPARPDYNLYFSSAGASEGTWIWQGSTYTGYSSYRSKTGNDSNSRKFLDPQFVSASHLNFDIKSSSPAENAGVNPGAGAAGTVDFAGNPRTRYGLINIGAYER
jgi:hypothetical protein